MEAGPWSRHETHCRMKLIYIRSDWPWFRRPSSTWVQMTCRSARRCSSWERLDWFRACGRRSERTAAEWLTASRHQTETFQRRSSLPIARDVLTVLLSLRRLQTTSGRSCSVVLLTPLLSFITPSLNGSGSLCVLYCQVWQWLLLFVCC